MHSKSSIMKYEDPLSSSAITNIIENAKVTNTGNLHGPPSSVVMEGHSEVTLKNGQHAATASTIFHCPVSELIWKIVSIRGMIVLFYNRSN